MTLILDGKKVRDSIADRLKKRVEALSVKPHLVIIQIGKNDESSTYIRQKNNFALRIGAVVTHHQLEESIEEGELLQKIAELNLDKKVHGILVQMPIPKTLDKNKIIEAIEPGKDVDGLQSKNIKMLWENQSQGFLPATTRGILSILDFYNISVAGKHVVVVGRSTLVGKPTALALLNRNATVTLCHSKSENLSQITKSAVILIVAAGVPYFITKEFVHKDQVVVDVGINLIDGTKLEDELPERKLVGDVDFENVKDSVSVISPVPGGVGPMTVASLFENLIEACEFNN